MELPDFSKIATRVLDGRADGVAVAVACDPDGRILGKGPMSAGILRRLQEQHIGAHIFYCSRDAEGRLQLSGLWLRSSMSTSL